MDCWRYLKRFIMESRSFPTSQISGRMYNTVVQLSVWCEECVAARHYAVICKQLLNANDINRVRWVLLGLLQDGPALISFIISARIAWRETYRMLPLSTHLYSHWSIPLRWLFQHWSLHKDSEFFNALVSIPRKKWFRNSDLRPKF